MAENNNIGNVNSDTNIPKSSGHDVNTKPQDKTENVVKTYLLGECKYDAWPESLQNLMAFLEINANEVRDLKPYILTGLIYLIMVESGFVPIDYNGPYKSYSFHHERMILLSKNPRIDWQSDGNTFTLKFKLSDLEQFETKLVITTHSDDLIVNCFVKGIDSTFELLLDPLTYFVSSRTALIQKIAFQHLDNLSLKIKDGISFPIKCAILQQNGIPCPCLINLPPEIILLITKKLNASDLRKLSDVNDYYFGIR